MPTWIEILPTPLDTQSAINFITDPRAGGVDLFLGLTRAETSAGSKKLDALHYEAYEEMALQKLNLLAERARGQWPIIKLAILHRIGRVAVGEASVIIAVSTPHRADAFAACKWLIDQLKVDVPIWKREIWADGSATWVQR